LIVPIPFAVMSILAILAMCTFNASLIDLTGGYSLTIPIQVTGTISLVVELENTTVIFSEIGSRLLGGARVHTHTLNVSLQL